MKIFTKSLFLIGSALLFLSACQSQKNVSIPQPYVPAETDVQQVEQLPDVPEVISEEEQEVPSAEVSEEEGDGKVPDVAVVNEMSVLDEAILSGDSKKCDELALFADKRDCLAAFEIEMEYGEGDASTQAPALEPQTRSAE